MRGDVQIAREMADDQCLRLAQTMPKSVFLLEAHLALGATLFHIGELASAPTHVKKNALIGQGSLIILWDGPGVGKTRLAMEMAEYASRRSFRCSVGLVKMSRSLFKNQRLNHNCASTGVSTVGISRRVTLGRPDERRTSA